MVSDLDDDIFVYQYKGLGLGDSKTMCSVRVI